MKTGPSTLTPFLRSDAQGAVLAETMVDPDTELSISEVARRASLLPAIAHREVTRLVEAAVLRDRREGNNRLVRANTEHPLWSLMSQLVVETYGPVPVLRDLLVDVAGVEQAYLYGSWAARRAGHSGPPPRDLDILVVGSPSRTDLLDVAEAARARLHTEVNIHLASPHAWADRTDPFLATVASRPLVTLKEPDHA
ncbi:MAG: nucleotidyltransferase domain-containing protein [Micrococcales bacterium]|nr:nucleotidyltransferase domain-containing protein [Micrococcales bacterium]